MIETTLSTYALITDAVPLREGGHGCSVLAWNWLEAMGSKVKLVVTHTSQNVGLERQVSADLRPSSAFFSDCSAVPLIGRFPLLTSLLNVLLFLFAWTRLRDRMRSSEAERLFVFCGAGFWILFVIWWLSYSIGLPLDVYLVDDFEESERMGGRHLTARMVRLLEARALRNVDRIFAISPGYVEHLCNKYKLKASWLPIPFPTHQINFRPFAPTDPDVREIAYLGAVNPLYISALKDCLDEISDWNSNAHAFKLRLVMLTYSDAKFIEAEFGRSPALEVIVGLTTSERQRRLAASWAVLLPSTFDMEFRLSVSTSFPSKLAECMPTGRPLLVYGPSEAALPRYFQENGLPLCITERCALRSAFNQLNSYDSPTIAQMYGVVMASHHSAQALRKSLSAVGDRAPGNVAQSPS